MPIRRTRRSSRKTRSTGRRLKGVSMFDAAGYAANATNLFRASGGVRRGRRIPATRLDIAQLNRLRSRSQTLNVRGQMVSGGDYSQFTEKRITTGKHAPKTLKQLYKEVRQQAEPTVFRFGGMLRHGPNGFFWCNKKISGDALHDSLPLYMYDLTAVNNTVNNVYTSAQPFYRAKVAVTDGSIQWDYVNGLNAVGTSANTLEVEKATSYNMGFNLPHEKSRLLYTDVRLNLYGAKTRAVKWIIQVVKLLDDSLDPIPTNAPSSASQPYQWQTKNSFYQGLMKPLVFNPLALTGAEQVSRRIKILKTYTTIIQPTSTTESDANPHCKILKWFMRWDRDLNFEQRGNILASGETLTNDSDYAVQFNQVSTYVKPSQKIFLMIRCNDYSVQDQQDTNERHASFDMSIRAKHVPM